jgi:ABC-2 type transport system permease protein/sodium transport system permease protein
VRALITAAVFGGLPIVIAMIGRVRWSSGLGFRRAGIFSFVAAAILGLCLWPAAHEITLLTEWLGLFTLTPEVLEKIEDVVKQFQSAPLWLLLAAFAVVPAIFEELCFRGFIFGSLRTRLSGAWTVIATALLFGLFHELLFPGKLIPSALLGLVLGWVRLRTGSVLPGMVLHAMHNGLVLSILYYRDHLQAHGWGVQEQAHLPLKWHGAALIGSVIGAGLLVAATRRNESPVSGSQSSG